LVNNGRRESGKHFADLNRKGFVIWADLQVIKKKDLKRTFNQTKFYGNILSYFRRISSLI
jgi:hypothetical protein